MKVTNTLSGKKEEFLPAGSEVRMYVCGVTPYSDAHLGHAMSYIIFDVVRRYLKFRGYKVKFVQNVTDIDDKIIDRANKLGISTRELAEKFTQSYFEDMQSLNVAPADVNPRATQEIPGMLEMIKGLVDRGYAYPSGGSVYFRVRHVPDYGKLSHRTLDAMKAGARIEPGEEKEDPMDFVLWKAAKPGEPSWDSPWGAGRPGWHIECSVMSLKYLGNTLDIHGGGQDLVFPHHENEMAQSESYTGQPFVKYWMHNGLVQLGGEKMSKSLGNFMTIKDLLKKYSADAIRIFVLSSHYRSPLTYSEEILSAAEKGADRLRQVIQSAGKAGKSGESMNPEPYRQRFIEAMDDDFNSAQAVAVLFDLARDINHAEETGMDTSQARVAFKELSEILGLTLKLTEREETPLDIRQLERLLADTAELAREKGLTIDIAAGGALDVNTVMDLLVSVRQHVRKARQFQLADNIRNKLAELGIAIEDTPQGTVWKRRR
ncbi:MAG: cysteine--tRNA ligase [Dehalococcoidales bacterium]|nr:cysteine--tRNA ligase [Dehalococcoidales bacterium]